jgi:tetratricopeptide (TPR) repeat protein
MTAIVTVGAGRSFAGMRAVLRRQQWWLCGVIAVLACLAFSAALAGEYVFDDIHSIEANPALYDLGNFGRLLTDPTAFSGTGMRMYRPVLLATLALNMAVSPAAASLKAGNLLLHVLVAVLLLGWLRRLGAARTSAFAAAALFAVHPLVSEVVNLVSARSEQLLVFGLLVALHGHLSWCRGGRTRLGIAGVVAGSVIACGSKETGVVLPGLLLVQDWLLRRVVVAPVPTHWVVARRLLDSHALQPVAQWGRRAVVRAAPAIVLVVAYLVLRRTLLGAATVSLLERSDADPLLGHGRGLATQLATMGTLLPQALTQVLAPIHLSLDPPVTFRQSPWQVPVLAGWLGVIGLSLAGLWRGRAARLRRLGVAFAWATALPWIVVPLNVPLAEHRLYGPLLGFALVLAGILPRRTLALRWPVPRTQRFALLALGAAVVTGVVRSAARSLEYRSEAELWRAETEARPDAWRAFWGLGTAHLRRGRFEHAVPPLAQAHALRPGDEAVHAHYAEALVGLSGTAAQPFLALVVAERLAAQTPQDPWHRTLWAEAILQVGKATGNAAHFAEAERLALSCLEIAPPKALVYRLAARARRESGDLAGALAHLDASIARGLDYVAVRIDRVEVLRDLGRHAEAQQELARAQAQAPMDPAVFQATMRMAKPMR